MIKNERQYRITKSQAARFLEAVEDFDQAPPKDLDPALVTAQREALLSQYNDLQKELDEYDALKDGSTKVLSISTLGDLSEALIKARVAAGLSQKDLADRLQMKEQQVQRYEATGYSSVSLARILDVVGALGISVRADVFLPTGDVSMRENFWESVQAISDEQRKIPSELRSLAGVAKQTFRADRLPTTQRERQDTTPSKADNQCF